VSLHLVSIRFVSISFVKIPKRRAQVIKRSVPYKNRIQQKWIVFQIMVLDIDTRVLIYTVHCN
jgi:hypothetical protein